MRVELLVMPDCLAARSALTLLLDALDQAKLAVFVLLIEVTSEAETERQRFPSSPTIRVNGRDIDHQPGARAALACRTYRHPDSRLRALLPRAAVDAAIRAPSHGDDRPVFPLP